jgi:hypothetical protein
MIISGSGVMTTGAVSDGHLAGFSGSSGNYIYDDEAPQDGNQYARKNAAWVAVTSGSGGSISGSGVMTTGAVSDGHLAVFSGSSGNYIKDGGSPYKANIVTNGSFDGGISGWSATAPATIAASGSAMLISRVSASFSVDMAYQDITVVAGGVYIVSFQVTAVNTGTTQCDVSARDNGLQTDYHVTTASEAYPQTVTFMLIAVSTTIRLIFRVSNNGTGTVTIDNVIMVRL